MDKANFKQMSRADLRAYIVATHDEEAIQELFVSRRNPSAQKYPFPIDQESVRVGEEAIREKIKSLAIPGEA